MSAERPQTTEQFRRLLEAASDVISVLGEDGTVMYVAGATERVLGRDAADLVGHDAFEHIHPDDREHVRESFFEALEAPGENAVAEYRYRHGEEEWRWLESRGGDWLEFDDARGVMVSTRDITERKARERELERYRTIVELTGDTIYTLDTEGRLTFVNEDSLSGYSPDEIVGRHVSFLMDEADIERGERLIRELLESDDRESGTFEMDLNTASGERIPCENHVALLRDDAGEFQGTVGVLRDISERVERERELQRQNERLEEFASVVSHDLRNPLAVAKGQADLATDTGDPDHVERVVSALDRMEALVDDLLELARQGRTVEATEPVDLAALAREAWAMVDTAGCEAELVVADDAVVAADPDRLSQVFENLFCNAVEHCPADSRRAGEGSRLTVRVGVLDDREGFYVADDGPGIPENEREAVFEHGYSTNDRGTGFGLSIVREVVTAHGWEIAATEGAGGGARFEITGVDVGGETPADGRDGSDAPGSR